MFKILKNTIFILLCIATLLLSCLIVYRLTLHYNSEGIYFDEANLNTIHQQAIGGYVVLLFMLLIVTILAYFIKKIWYAEGYVNLLNSFKISVSIKIFPKIFFYFRTITIFANIVTSNENILITRNLKAWLLLNSILLKVTAFISI